MKTIEVVVDLHRVGLFLQWAVGSSLGAHYNALANYTLRDIELTPLGKPSFTHRYGKTLGCFSVHCISYLFLLKYLRGSFILSTLKSISTFSDLFLTKPCLYNTIQNVPHDFFFIIYLILGFNKQGFLLVFY